MIHITRLLADICADFMAYLMSKQPWLISSVQHLYLAKGWLMMYLVLALLMKQLAQVVQAAGDRALVGMRVLQVLIRDICTGVECVLGLFNIPLGHQDNAHVQVCSFERGHRERW